MIDDRWLRKIKIQRGEIGTKDEVQRWREGGEREETGTETDRPCTVTTVRNDCFIRIVKIEPRGLVNAKRLEHDPSHPLTVARATWKIYGILIGFQPVAFDVPCSPHCPDFPKTPYIQFRFAALFHLVLVEV
jgi:hypothetical protein